MSDRSKRVRIRREMSEGESSPDEVAVDEPEATEPTRRGAAPTLSQRERASASARPRTPRNHGNRRHYIRPILYVIAALIAAFAFFGMGEFMYTMGNNMSTMTKSVSQMGHDVSSMARDMQTMTSRMDVMANSMVQGQAGMSADFTRVREGVEYMAVQIKTMAGDMGAMSEDMHSLNVNIDTMNRSMASMNGSMAVITGSMGRMGYDINKFTRPESIMLPFLR